MGTCISCAVNDHSFSAPAFEVNDIQRNHEATNDIFLQGVGRTKHPTPLDKIINLPSNENETLDRKDFDHIRDSITLMEVCNDRHILLQISQHLSILDLSYFRMTNKRFNKLVTWYSLSHIRYTLRVVNSHKWTVTFRKIDMNYHRPEQYSVAYVLVPLLDQKVLHALRMYMAFVDRISAVCLYSDKFITPDTYYPSSYYGNPGRKYVTTLKYLLTIKSCVRIRYLELGGVGISSSLSNDELTKLLKLIGKNLYELRLIKQDRITCECLDIVNYYCKKLHSLSLFACSYSKYDCNGDVTYSSYLRDFIESAGSRITFLDLRYSLDITDDVLDMISTYIPHDGKFKAFLGSNNFSNEDRIIGYNCCQYLSDPCTLTFTRWKEFVKNFSNAHFLAVDDLYYEVRRVKTQKQTSELKLYFSPSLLNDQIVNNRHLIEIFNAWPILLENNMFDGASNIESPSPIVHP